MKKTNRLKYWEDELKKYGDVGGVGVVKPSNPPSLTPPGNSKNTDSKNPLDIYNDYIKESNTPSAPDLAVNPKLPSSIPTNPFDKDKGFAPVDKNQFFDSRVVGTVGGGFSGGKKGGVTDEGEIIGNPNLEKFPTIKDGSNRGGVGDYNPKNSEPTSPTIPTAPKTNPSTMPTIPTPPNPSTSTSMTNPSSSTTETTPSNKFSAKYQGTDFLEWYRANYGQEYDPSTILSRKSGMSDVDWDIGNSLYDTYRKDQQRKSDYESRVSALDKSKMQSQQNASITLDKLKKYLPTQIKAQGLGGLGVSESSLLNAYNSYSSDMGAIENDYQDRKSSLEEAYAQDNLQSWQTSKDSVSGIFDGYKSAFENNQKQAYQDAYNTVSQSTETNESAILKYIEQFRNRLSDSDFLTLTQQAKQVAQANKQAYDKEQVAKTEQQQKSTYEDAKENIKNLPFTSQEEMDRYIERFRGQVTEGQLNRLFGDGIDRVLENQKSKEEQDKADTYSEIYGTAKEYIDKQDYDNAIKYLEANKELLGRQYDVLMSQINLEKETEKEKERYSDYFKINKLSNGNDIKALRDINTRYNVKPADSENLEFQIEAGDNIYGVKLGDTVASSEQADVKKYMYSAYGRKPQAGDLCYYAGQIVVVCQNGNLRYLKDAPNFLGTWNWWGVKHLEDLVNLVNVDYD
jgi:hypothetical protein